MNREILLITEQLKDTYEGDPWFGRSVKAILNEVDETIAFEKPNGQHSIIELLWHMITWKEFVVSRLRADNDQSLADFEKIDWRELDHSDKSLWKKGQDRLTQIHKAIVDNLQQQDDDLLPQLVGERNYNFRKLLHGIIEHDIYHLGQIAYIRKLLK